MTSYLCHNKFVQFICLSVTNLVLHCSLAQITPQIEKNALEWWNETKGRNMYIPGLGFCCKNPIECCMVDGVFRPIDQQVSHVRNKHVRYCYRATLTKDLIKQELLQLTNGSTENSIFVGPACEFDELKPNKVPIYFYCTAPNHGIFTLTGALDHYTKKCHAHEFRQLTNANIRNLLKCESKKMVACLKNALKDNSTIICNNCKQEQSLEHLFKHTNECWSDKQKERMNRRVAPYSSSRLSSRSLRLIRLCKKHPHNTRTQIDM